MLFVTQFNLKKNIKKEEYENDEYLKKDFPYVLFPQLDFVTKQLILDFDYNSLERQCFAVNQILINFNYFFRFSELCKTSRSLIFSINKKSKIVRNVSSCITETFNGYKVVRHENHTQMWTIFHQIMQIWNLSDTKNIKLIISLWQIRHQPTEHLIVTIVKIPKESVMNAIIVPSSTFRKKDSTDTLKIVRAFQE